MSFFDWKDMDPETKPKKRIYKKKEKEKEKEKEMRAPDSYKTETLVDQMETIHLDSFQEKDELEEAKLASLEESWKYQTACEQRWSMFQPMLSRLQRLGTYDKNIKTVYDLLSVALYRYSYNADTSISEAEYIFIDKHLQFFRISPADKSNLYTTLNRLRFENTGV